MAWIYPYKKYIRSNYRKTGGHIDYGDVCGILVGKRTDSFTSDAIYTYVMSGSAGDHALGDRFQGSFYFFVNPLYGSGAGSDSTRLWLPTPFWSVSAGYHTSGSGGAIIGLQGMFKSKGVVSEWCAALQATGTVAYQYLILVVSR